MGEIITNWSDVAKPVGNILFGAADYALPTAGASGDSGGGGSPVEIRAGVSGGGGNRQSEVYLPRNEADRYGGVLGGLAVGARVESRGEVELPKAA